MYIGILGISVLFLMLVALPTALGFLSVTGRSMHLPAHGILCPCPDRYNGFKMKGLVTIWEELMQR